MCHQNVLSKRFIKNYQKMSHQNVSSKCFINMFIINFFKIYLKKRHIRCLNKNGYLNLLSKGFIEMSQLNVSVKCLKRCIMKASYQIVEVMSVEGTCRVGSKCHMDEELQHHPLCNSSIGRQHDHFPGVEPRPGRTLVPFFFVATLGAS